MLQTIGLRLNQVAGFSWKIREKTADFGVIICFNDRSRLTVLDWIVKEAQHFFFKRKDNQIELSLKLSDNLTL